MMSNYFRSWFLLTSVSVSLFLGGCSSQTNEKPAERPSAGGNAKPTTTDKEKAIEKQPTREEQKSEGSTVAANLDPATSAALTIPKVALSEELRATCLVNVGDAMPEAKLPDTLGRVHELREFHGQKLTVVCCWAVGKSARSKLVASTLLRDLTKEVVGPYGGRGVAVVGINVGDARDAILPILSEASANFPILLDAKGDLFARVAKEGKMPRTFLLDAKGRILWFDLEYSNSARRDLVQAIKAALAAK